MLYTRGHYIISVLRKQGTFRYQEEIIYYLSKTEEQ